jgi:hypothetical protein
MESNYFFLCFEHNKNVMRKVLKRSSGAENRWYETKKNGIKKV